MYEIHKDYSNGLNRIKPNRIESNARFLNMKIDWKFGLHFAWWNRPKNHAWNLTGNLTRKVKTSPFLGLLGTQTVQKLLWDGPGGLASALASAWDMPNLVFMHFEAKKRTKTGVFWHEIWLKKWKRVRSWPFWGQKNHFLSAWRAGTCLGGLAHALVSAWDMPDLCLRPFWGPNLKKIEIWGSQKVGSRKKFDWNCQLLVWKMVRKDLKLIQIWILSIESMKSDGEGSQPMFKAF